MKIDVFSTERFAAAAAERIADAIADVWRCTPVCRLALAGGSTPGVVYRALAQRALDWSRLELFFGDERAVAPDAPESNYHVALEAFGDVASQLVIVRMQGEAADLEAEAQAYAARIAEGLDIVLLGIGEDGHTASIFPGSPLFSAAVDRQLVAVVRESPKPPPTRLSLTPTAIRNAGRRFVLATGLTKAAIVAQACTGSDDERELPIRIARDGDWLLDTAAATGLPHALRAKRAEV
ncbi:MAG: 6-phosphogluconolactonase [Myxococcales bacterium]|nr:6-phosphogluconolactonase [Myxococcales bacterium]